MRQLTCKEREPGRLIREITARRPCHGGKLADRISTAGFILDRAVHRVDPLAVVHSRVPAHDRPPQGRARAPWTGATIKQADDDH